MIGTVETVLEEELPGRGCIVSLDDGTIGVLTPPSLTELAHNVSTCTGVAACTGEQEDGAMLYGRNSQSGNDFDARGGDLCS